MTPERWKQIKTIYQQVVETAPERRAAFLTAKCGDDADLRGEIEDMLRFESNDADFIEEPAFNVAVGLLAEDDTLSRDKKLGNYRIVQEIGRGGMGAVYLAERTDGLFEQRVALKIIKRGMDTDAILKRFVMERQILANLDHPNIARLLDGGTTADGLPFFVMEYVEGLPIHQYCERKNLSLDERLALFRKVCAAVSYAHQNLIVHRDLKPSNILVTEAGEPKLLDFGIAKLLHSELMGETQATETVARMLTPEYASPEQFKGERITTQSDVYSLGVLLSKIVQSPLNAECGMRSAEEAPGNQTSKIEERRTKDKTKTPHSALRIPHSKDLQAILQTALREEPARRYSSVEAFSDDIRRLLEGLPVKAQRDSFFYRASKFVGRNAATVSLSLLMIFALVFAAAFSIWQARCANVERARAERRFNDVRKLANNVLFDYHDKIENLPNSTAVREKMLKDSLEYLDGLSSEAANDKELLRELGAAYEKVGTIQGNTYKSNVGNAPAMMESYRKSFEIREKLAALDPNNEEIQRELAMAYENMGDGFAITGELKKSLENHEKARLIINGLAARNEKHLIYLARLHSKIADVQGYPGTNNLGDPASATQNYRQAVEIAQKFYESEPQNPRYRQAITAYRNNYGNILLFNGDSAAALEQLNLAVSVAENWVRDEPNNAVARDTLEQSYSKISDIYEKLEDYPKAVEFQKKAIASAEPAYLADPKNERARGVNVFYFKLADLYTRTENFAEAEKFYLKALDIQRQTVADNPANMEAQLRLADVTFEYAALFMEKREFDKALPVLENCLKIYEDMAARDASNNRVRVDAAQTLVGMGDIYLYKKQYAAALPYYEKARPVLVELSQPDKIGAPLQRFLTALETKIKDARAKIS